MKFTNFNLSKANGVILAHTIRLDGIKINKGTTLGIKELGLLQAVGIGSILGAQLDPDDIHENDAALDVAIALCGSHLTVGKAKRGRVNLIAKQQGVVVIDKSMVDAVNLSQTSVTIATLPEFSNTQENQIVATIKVIPFAVNNHIIDKCVAILTHSITCSRNRAISIKAYQQHQIGLILTRNEETKATVLDATQKVTKQRLICLGNKLDYHIRCLHRPQRIRLAFQKMLTQQCDLIIVCGASVTVDVADIIPTTIVALGGRIEQFGMPVKPGNMLLLGYISTSTVIILPGCSRSPKLNGFDWVLQRYLSHTELNQNVIRQMGVGGLIKTKPKALPTSIPSKHSPLLNLSLTSQKTTTFRFQESATIVSY